MKYLKLYEELSNISELEVGDYVLLKVVYLSKEWENFINNTPGKIVKKNVNIIQVQYKSDDIPDDFREDYFIYENGKYVYNCTINSVVVFAKTLEELKRKNQFNKYNINR